MFALLADGCLVRQSSTFLAKQLAVLIGSLLIAVLIGTQLEALVTITTGLHSKMTAFTLLRFSLCCFAGAGIKRVSKFVAV